MDHGSAAGMDAHSRMISDFRRRFVVSLVLTAPILILSPSIQRGLHTETSIAFHGQAYVLFGLATIVYAYGGWPFFKGLWQEISKRRPGMMTLVALAVSIAYAYSTAVVFGLHGDVLFWELATLIDVMLLGHWLEMRSVMGAGSALERLAELLPHDAHRLRAGGDVEDVPLQSLRPGDRLLVRPGERIPVDGSIAKGETSVDLFLVTGESRPVYRKPGQELIGGSINGEGAVEMIVEKTGSETYLARVIRTVREAQESRSRSQDLADRAALILTLIAIVSGTATIIVWLVLGFALEFSLSRSVSVMVITCPHALGLAIPLVVAVSTGIAARRGILIRDRSAFERSRLIDVVVFDKTGTLTEGKFSLTDVVPFYGRSSDEVLSAAASVEAGSEHPIARAIVKEAEDRGLRIGRAEDFSAIPGRGARAIIQGREVMVVSPGYLLEMGLQTADPRLDQIEAQGKTLIFLIEAGKPVGAMALGDRVREETREAIASLQASGITCIMMTGDSEGVAARISQELGIGRHLAQVAPQEKSRRVRELQEQGRVVAMVGDGINDAPALAQADVGMAIGAGTDIAIESGDVVLVRSDPRDVEQVIEMGRVSYRKMAENLAWATGYNLFAIPLAAGVLYPFGILLTPAVGAVLMSLSTLIVAFNARSFKTGNRKKGRGSGRGFGTGDRA
jgi:Cu2+-exporting ATPase